MSFKSFLQPDKVTLKLVLPLSPVIGDTATLPATGAAELTVVVVVVEVVGAGAGVGASVGACA